MEISRNDFECHVNPRREPIAVIGIGCRFPGGVKGADSFWKMLLNRTDAITDVPPERWNHAIFYLNRSNSRLAWISTDDKLANMNSPEGLAAHRSSRARWVFQ